MIAELRNFSAYWGIDNYKENKKVLKKINMEIFEGKLYCIIGRVGCGKSSLLNSFLREIPLYSGEIRNENKISYIEQEPYIY